MTPPQHDRHDRYDAVFPLFPEIVLMKRKTLKCRHICHVCHGQGRIKSADSAGALTPAAVPAAGDPCAPHAEACPSKGAGQALGLSYMSTEG